MAEQFNAMPRLRASVKAGSYDADAHTVRWVMSDETVDRDGESISVKGWEVPGSVPLLWGHRSWGDVEDVIGKVEAATVEGGQLVGFVRFSQENERGRLVERMVAEGILENGSVGFEPMAWTDKDGSTHERERGAAYPYPEKGRKYTKTELAEFSVVPVPSNPSAVAKMAKALETKPDTDETARLREEIDELRAIVQTVTTVNDNREKFQTIEEFFSEGLAAQPATAEEFFQSGIE